MNDTSSELPPFPPADLPQFLRHCAGEWMSLRSQFALGIKEQLGPDGSLELVIAADGLEVRERIWFTKPNLRLRSTVENRAGGAPGRACFSSEIRRVSRPATTGAPSSR